MPLTPQLIAAYETALYALTDGPVLRIGERSAALDGLLAQRAVASAAFITAANPRGEPQSHAKNEAAMASLRASLSWPWLEGEGRDPEGRWPAEPSVLVLGIGRGEAEALGRRLEQNAIVFVEKGSAPELVLLATMRLVIDTQVWLDWLVFDDPSVAALRRTIAMQNVEVLIDDACLAELERVLSYPLNRNVDVAACLAVCRQTARRVKIDKTQKLPVCRDPDDQKFLELAAGAKADCVVTRDRDLLGLTRRCAPWFRIVPPEAFGQGMAGGEQNHEDERGAGNRFR